MDTDSAPHSAGAGPADSSRGPRKGAGLLGRPRRRGSTLTAGLRITGAGLLIAAAGIHLDLYVTGYRSIPVIGGLFLLQVIAAFLLGTAVLVTGSRLAAAAGAAFALATLGGYLLSVWVGLFGFREIRTTAGIAVGIVEVAAFAALAVLVTRPRASGQPSRWRVPGGQATAWLNGGVTGAVTVVGGVSAVALVLLGVAVAGAGGPPAGPAADARLQTATVNGTTVLTNGKGFTLYWFAPDTPARSDCTGTCAQYWPPVIGRPTTGRAIAGGFGTITRPDGSAQATYNGHPLYTYVGDTAPGQANGNNLNLNGGRWHEVTVSG